MKNRFRYSESKFKVSFLVALGLTAMVTGLTWLIFTRVGNPNANTYTAIAAFVFLAFFSAKMALLYFRDEVVLAILPSGIDDARWDSGLVPWERIKEITVSQRESEYELNVHLWPQRGVASNLSIDLDVLESDVETIVAAISTHMPVRADY